MINMQSCTKTAEKQLIGNWTKSDKLFRVSKKYKEDKTFTLSLYSGNSGGRMVYGTWKLVNDTIYEYFDEELIVDTISSEKILFYKTCLIDVNDSMLITQDTTNELDTIFRFTVE